MHAILAFSLTAPNITSITILAVSTNNLALSSVGVPAAGSGGVSTGNDRSGGSNSNIGLSRSNISETAIRRPSDSDVSLGLHENGPASRRTRVFWGRSEMDKLLTWIEQNKPDSIGHGRREDCARIKNEVFSLRGDYTTKTIKEKLLNMEKKFKKAQEIKFSAGTNDLSGIEDSAIKGMYSTVHRIFIQHKIINNAALFFI